MTIDKTSRLYKWTYFLEGKWNGFYDGPDRTSLCAFFWRCFVWMPLFWIVMVALVSSITFLVSVLTIKSHGLFLIIPTTAFVTFLVISGGRGTVSRAIDRVGDRIERTVFWQGARTIKSKFCPIITFKD